MRSKVSCANGGRPVAATGIGHLKTGNWLHAVLCAAGYNIRWLLRMIAKKGEAFLAALLLRLCTVAGVSPNWLDTLRNFAFNELRAPAQ